MTARDDQRREKGRPEPDQSEELQRALQPEQRPDLQGDAEENRNLSGSTTWETLTDADRKEDRGRSDE